MYEMYIWYISRPLMYQLYISYIEPRPELPQLPLPGGHIHRQLTEPRSREVARHPVGCLSLAPDVHRSREQPLLSLAAEPVEDQMPRVALLLFGREQQL